MNRVLHVLGSLNFGGSQILVLSLLKSMKKNNIVYDIVIDKENEIQMKNEFEKLGSKIFVLPRFKGYNIISYLIKWNHFYKTHPEYKIVHGHVRSTAILYLTIAKKNGLYTIIHSHGTTSGKGVKAYVKNIMQFFIRYVADYYLSCSDEAGEWLYGKKIVNSSNYKVLINGIDFSEYDYNALLRKELRKNYNYSNCFVVGSVGRLTWEKNQFFLIKVFYEIKKIKKNAKLLIIGNKDEPIYSNLTELIKKYNIMDDVCFFGPTNEVNKMLNLMDCYICTSTHEGFSISTIEAEANGLPCYVSSSLPKSVKISNNIKFIDIKKDEKKWAEIILNSDLKRSINNYDEKYDIKKSASWLSELYKSID